jgi:secondary thiamine-phosphate synthase enzyme
MESQAVGTTGHRPPFKRVSGMQQKSGTIVVDTGGPGFLDVSRRIDAWLREGGADEGLLTVFIRHTSASLTIQENADPDVRIDLMRKLDSLAPQHDGYVHDTEGPDDMPAHIKSMLTATSLSIPVANGRMVLGTWQGVYVVEHRSRPHRRELALHFLGTLKGNT